MQETNILFPISTSELYKLPEKNMSEIENPYSTSISPQRNSKKIGSQLFSKKLNTQLISRKIEYELFSKNIGYQVFSKIH